MPRKRLSEIVSAQLGCLQPYVEGKTYEVTLPGLPSFIFRRSTTVDRSGMFCTPAA
jgi:hypothetical protein